MLNTGAPLIYLHIPKTAGTSFRISAEHYFGPSNVLHDYGIKSPATSKEILSNVYENDNPQTVKEIGSQKSLLTGHFSLAKYQPLFPDSPVVTFFRHPVDRVVSEYIHFTNHLQYQGSLSEFYRLKRSLNRQFRTLSGVSPRELDFFGVTEHYELSLRLFNERYNTTLPSTVLNQGSYEGNIRDLASASEISEIEELNQQDFDIYNYAVENLSAQMNKPAAVLDSVDRYSGTLGGVHGDQITGWTLDRQSDQPAEICVTVNGEERGTHRANVFRGDLQRRRIHVNGICGFAIPLESLGGLTHGDKIAVVSADRTFELANSPITFAA